MTIDPVNVVCVILGGLGSLGLLLLWQGLLGWRDRKEDGILRAEEQAKDKALDALRRALSARSRGEVRSLQLELDNAEEALSRARKGAA